MVSNSGGMCCSVLILAASHDHATSQDSLQLLPDAAAVAHQGSLSKSEGQHSDSTLRHVCGHKAVISSMRLRRTHTWYWLVLIIQWTSAKTACRPLWVMARMASASWAEFG